MGKCFVISHLTLIITSSACHNVHYQTVINQIYLVCLKKSVDCLTYEMELFLVMNGHTNHEVSLQLTDLMYVHAILKKFFIHANLITFTEQMLGISLNSMSISHCSALVKRILMVKSLQAG